jgi:Xaa-Pro dipeptidase
MSAVQSIKISEQEHRQRCARLRQHLEDKNLSGVVLFDNAYILYYSGFAFIPTERPIAMVMDLSGEIALVVPRLELEHARAQSVVERVKHYIEYPDQEHPAQLLKNVMLEMGVEGNYAADRDGYPWVLGYQGPSLSELMGQKPRPVSGYIEAQMMVKSEAELALIRESVKWGNLAHTLLQRYTRPGATETEVSLRASMEATLAMLDAIGPIYRAQSPFSDGASAGYRGQIGRNAAIPHAMANNIVFQPGDVLVTGAGAPVWGYDSELERTMLVGEANDRQRRLFEHMLSLQDTALDAIRPGVHCSQVDRKVRAYYEEHQLSQYWKHHSGHAIGLRYHEGPFLDVGDDTLIQPGMVFTVEPGLYVPDIGGFRHSDTVAVTETGIEILTFYARDLESLTVPV